MIEKKFGSYGLDVIENNNENRISFLFSNGDHYIALNKINAVKKSTGYKKKYHTLALVSFIDSAKISEVHKKIIEGGSVGATFKDYGWSITKDSLLVLELSRDIHPVIQKWLKSKTYENLAVHVYTLTVKNKTQTIRYAEIIEIHHPDYLSLTKLKDIYDINSSREQEASAFKIKNIIIDKLSNNETRQTILNLLGQQGEHDVNPVKD
tara:strand:- start:2872 stop:3495 length:624 start_codon:yes stop_codon:yes gene_type:complete